MAVKKRFNACHLVQTTRLYFESKRMLHLSVNRGKRIIKHANKSDCSTKRDAIKEFSPPFFFFFFFFWCYSINETRRIEIKTRARNEAVKLN